MKQSLMLFAALIGGILSAWKNLTASFASAPSNSRIWLFRLTVSWWFSQLQRIKSNLRRSPAKLKQNGGG
jgi:hypothetical protein